LRGTDATDPCWGSNFDWFSTELEINGLTELGAAIPGLGRDRHMSYDSPYAWIVVCKNEKFHRRDNAFFGYKIALAETDPFASPPSFEGTFRARCDKCGQEYAYNHHELMKLELDLPGDFKPHPLFA
jgi:hypothetical protein